MFKRLKKAAKRWIHKVSGNTTILEALGTSPVTSKKMRNAISLWAEMYENRAKWLHTPDENDPNDIISLGLPASIAGEKARMATLELKSKITSVDGGESERSIFLNKNYQRGIIDEIRRQSEYAIAKGGIAITPYIVYDADEPRFAFDFTQAEKFIPLGFDSSGKITDGAFLIIKETAEYTYFRLERQTYGDGVLTISNRAFKRSAFAPAKKTDIYDIVLGDEIQLREVPEWSQLATENVYTDVDRPFFAYLKMPLANTIDPDSPLGVSGYSRAVDLIRKADIQHARLDWEYDAGQMIVDADSEAFPDQLMPDGSYQPKIPLAVQRYFRLRDTGDSTSYNVFAPSLRDSAYIAGLDNLKMEIEDVCALSRGVLSRTAEQARTATELKILRQRTYSENASIQEAIQKALEDVVYIMDAYTTIYDLVGDKVKSGGQRCQASFEWDDSIIVDRDTELQQRLTLMERGIAGRVENRMWYYGETEKQAIEALKKIDAENEEIAAAQLNNIGEV